MGIPGIFPADLGFAPRDGFATDCAHRHSVSCCSDPSHEARGGGGKSREFAWFWGAQAGRTEPEASAAR